MITNTSLFLVPRLMSCLPVLLALLSASFASSPIRAETVETLVTKAVGENPEIRFYEAEIEAAKAGKESVVVIHADAAARHQAVITVMEAARHAGLSQITFATQSSMDGAR